MKLLLTIILLSSVLFSMDTQKQIILGSYSANKNGINAARILNKQIENDKKLKIFMKKNSLNVTNSTISGYTVVSVKTFNTYKSLFRGMKLFQKYYNDAYVLSYPAKDTVTKEVLEEVKEKAIQEKKLEEEMLEKERLEEEMLEQIRLEGFAKKKLEDDKRLEEELLKIEEDIKVQKERKEAEKLKYVNPKKDEGIELSDYYILIFLGALILIIGSVAISKKDEDIEV